MPFLPFLVTAVLCVVTGRSIARALGLPSSGAAGYAWATALGTGAVSLVLFAVAAVRGFAWLPEGPARLLFVAVPAGLSLLLPRGRREEVLPFVPRSLSPWAVPPLLVGALLLVSALGPETGEDALDYHLPAAARLASEGLGAHVGCLDAEYRLGVDLLWTPGVVAGERIPFGSAVLSALFSTALAAAVFAEVRRRASVAAAGVVATLFLLAPVVADYAVLGFVDAAVALYGFLGLAAVAAYLRDEPGPWPVVAGTLAGLAAGAKLSGASWLLVIPFAITLGELRRETRPGVTAALAGVLVASPWFVRNWIVLGNPLFPLGAGRGFSGWVEPEAVRLASRAVLDQTGIARGPWMGFEGTWRAIFDPAMGFDGPAWVLALLPAALVKPNTPERRALIGAGLVAWAAWAWFVPVPRFGLGVWAWGAVAAGVGAQRIADGGRGFAVALATLALVVAAIDGRVVARRSGERIVDGLLGDPARYVEHTVREPWQQAEIAQDLPAPVGVVLGGTAWAGPGAISLVPKRCGAYGPKDLQDSEKLLAVCRRLGIRSLVIPDYATSEPRPWVLPWRRAAEAWRAAGEASVGVLYSPKQDEWMRVVLEERGR